MQTLTTQWNKERLYSFDSLFCYRRLPFPRQQCTPVTRRSLGRHRHMNTNLHHKTLERILAFWSVTRRRCFLAMLPLCADVLVCHQLPRPTLQWSASWPLGHCTMRACDASPGHARVWLSGRQVRHTGGERYAYSSILLPSRLTSPSTEPVVGSRR